jgi:hypothetical protein
MLTKEVLLEISNDAENKSNKDLFIAVNELYEEYNKTKELIINLTRHLESVELLYNNVNREIEKRTKK